MLMIREPAARKTQSVWQSFSLQMFFGLLAGVLVPATLFFEIFSVDRLATGVYNSIAASVVASVFGTILIRKVTAFPGVKDMAYIIPSYASSYAIAVISILALRLEYSRTFLTLSIAGSILAAFVGAYTRKGKRQQFYVVPHGRIDLVHDTPDVDWIMLTRPQVPADLKDVIVADLKFDHPPEWERMLAEAAVRGHVVYHTKQLRESLTGRVSIDHLSENSFGSLVPNLAYVKIKRLVDLLSALAVTPLLLPLFALLAILIRLDSPGPIFFKQERMGYRGRIFLMIKFRTMRVREKAGRDNSIRDAMTKDDDDRVTKIGRFLRRTRLDELPQVFNIIRGEMSWIGPRPEAIALSKWYEEDIPFYSYRHIVRPGITGWAQVNQGHVTDIDSVATKLSYDFYYIKNFSFSLDVLISLRTMRTIATGFGAR